MIDGRVRSKVEIQRLVQLGFKDWPEDKFGVRTRSNLVKSAISFPSEIYTGEQLSNTDYWSRVRVMSIVNELKRFGVDVLWELGAGDGRVSISLVREGFGVVCQEPIYSGCSKIAKELIPVYCASLGELDLPKNSLAAVGFFDVLEHIKDDNAFLNEVRELLIEEGIMILTVPAHQWLFSNHDKALGHFRRYGRYELKQLIASEGYEILEDRYLFSSLVIASFLFRKLPNFFGIGQASVSSVSRQERALKVPLLLDKILFKFFLQEQKIKLPFGLSLLLVARKARK